MGLANAYETDAVGRRVEFQTRLVEAKTGWEATHDEFVTDRTTFDNLVYSVMHGASGITDQYFELACKGLHRYEYIVYCPVSVFIDVSDDPARVKDMTYHTLYDATLWGLLQKFRPPEVRLITMPFPHLQHRKDFLRSLLKTP
jgi:AAA domain